MADSDEYASVLLQNFHRKKAVVIEDLVGDKVLHTNGRFPSNTRLGQKWQTVTNTLAYCNKISKV